MYRLAIATDEKLVHESTFGDLSVATKAFTDFGVLEAMKVAYESGAGTVACFLSKGNEVIMAHSFMSNWHRENGMEWLDMATPFKEVVWKARED